MYVLMGSVFVGFLFFAAGWANFSYKGNTKITWILVLTAFLLCTVVPVITALFWAVGSPT